MTYSVTNTLNDLATRPLRNWGIDCLRGLAILLVVLNHLGLSFRLPLKKSLLMEYLPKRLLNALSFNGYEAVFIFFVISGFLICTRVLVQQSGLQLGLQQLDWRAFYLRRASRIVPLLLALLLLLSVLHGLGVPGYRIEAPGQSLPGALFSALGLYLNWYEGQTTWLPASWDVLWSLSIEEVFYLAFPLLCIALSRQSLVAVLLLLALSVPITKAALDGHEIWQEKAYLPGIGAIATGVLCALAVQHWRTPPAWLPRVLLGVGIAGLAAVGVWGDGVWQALGHGNMLVLLAATAALVVACHHLCEAHAAPKGLGWLARMGQLSYEIYLSHMFVVLTAVLLFRQTYAPDLRWGFVVYLPCIAACVLLAAMLERWLTQPAERWLRSTPLRAA